MLLVLNAAGCVTESDRPQPWEPEKRAEIRVDLAWSYMKREQFDVAETELKAALKLDPDHSGANYAMGILSWRLQQLDNAERYLRKAVSSDRTNLEARRELGSFLCGRDRRQDGLRELDRVIQDPLDPQPELTRARAGACLMETDRARAEQYFRQALDRDPSLGSALLPMVTIRYDDGDYLGARAFLERYLGANPETPRSLWYGVQIERALGASDAADRYARRLRTRFPRSDEAREIAAGVQ